MIKTEKTFLSYINLQLLFQLLAYISYVTVFRCNFRCNFLICLFILISGQFEHKTNGQTTLMSIACTNK